MVVGRRGDPYRTMGEGRVGLQLEENRMGVTSGPPSQPAPLTQATPPLSCVLVAPPPPPPPPHARHSKDICQFKKEQQLVFELKTTTKQLLIKGGERRARMGDHWLSRPDPRGPHLAGLVPSTQASPGLNTEPPPPIIPERGGKAAPPPTTLCKESASKTHQNLPEPIPDPDVQLLPVGHVDEPALRYLRHLVHQHLVRRPDPHLLEAQPSGSLRRGLRAHRGVGLGRLKT